MPDYGRAQSMPHLLQLRREGAVPSSNGGATLGGQTSARASSAGVRASGAQFSFGFRKSMGEHPSVIERLRHTATLRGHTQCVNRLCWNQDGSAIASVSDDTTVCLFDAASADKKLQFPTGHRRNILGVKILPCTNDQMIVTGAMDGEVRLHKAPFSSPELTECFACHDARVNAIEVQPGSPFVFWSASEDGTVRQFDRRLPNAGCRSAVSEDPSHGPAHGRRHLGANNCVVALTSDGQSGGDSPDPFERSNAQSRQQPGRAMHVACNPSDGNYLAVACGDIFARVFDRRVLSLGTAADRRAKGRGPVLSFCPPHAHPAAGSACGSTSHLLSRMRSPFPAAQHSTCVAFSPNGRDLLVSYHRDHVYLFDATGTRTDTAGGGDPAISSYFLPRPASPQRMQPGLSSLPKHLKSWVGDSDCRSRVSNKRVGDGLRDRSKATFARSRRGLPRRTRPRRCPVHMARREDLEELLSDAHRSLAAWNGSSEPPTTSTQLAELYSRRHALLRGRGWRGDGYMALLDAARAKELAPTSAQARWQYVEALSYAGKYSASRAEAARCEVDFPELKERAADFIHQSMGSRRRSGGVFSLPDRGSGRQESSDEEEAEAETGAESKANDDADADFHTPPRTSSRRASWNKNVNEGGRNRGGDSSGRGGDGSSNSSISSSSGSSRSRSNSNSGASSSDGDASGDNSSDGEPDGCPSSPRSRLDADRCLSGEVAAAQEWYRRFSRMQDTGQDARCASRPEEEGLGKGSSLRPILEGRQRGPAANVGDWTTRLSGQRLPTTVESSPQTMIQWYPGARNVETVIKEASFLGDQGGYVAAGSDDGRMFIWERATGRLIKAIHADDTIVNCVAPHPSLPVIATSGIESVVRLWSPLAAEDEDLAQSGAQGASHLLAEISRNNQGNMDDAVGMSLALRPLMHQLVVEITSVGAGRDDDGGPGECIQA